MFNVGRTPVGVVALPAGNCCQCWVARFRYVVLHYQHALSHKPFGLLPTLKASYAIAGCDLLSGKWWLFSTSPCVGFYVNPAGMHIPVGQCVSRRNFLRSYEVHHDYVWWEKGHCPSLP